MKEQGVDRGEMLTLQWSGDLTIRRIAELKEQVQQALVTAKHVSIVIAADAECDTTLMQLLCAAHRTASRQDKTLQIGGDLSPQFKKIMNLAGFSRHIGCALDKSGCCIWKLVHQQLTSKELPRVVAPN